MGLAHAKLPYTEDPYGNYEYKNNTWQASGDPAAGTNEAFSTAMAPSIYPAASVYYGTGDAVTIRSRAAEFSYSPPSGFTEWASP